MVMSPKPLLYFKWPDGNRVEMGRARNGPLFNGGRSTTECSAEIGRSRKDLYLKRITVDSLAACAVTHAAMVSPLLRILNSASLTSEAQEERSLSNPALPLPSNRQSRLDIGWSRAIPPPPVSTLTRSTLLRLLLAIPSRSPSASVTFPGQVRLRPTAPGGRSAPSR